MLCHIFSKLAMRSLADSPPKNAGVAAKGNPRAGRTCPRLAVAARSGRAQIKTSTKQARERLRRMTPPRESSPINDLWVARRIRREHVPLVNTFYRAASGLREWILL